MQSKIFKESEASEAAEFIKELEKANNVVVAFSNKDNDIKLSWIPNKTYTDFKGNVLYDEVWTTESGDLILCQNLTLAHARNIIRLGIRADRARSEHLMQVTEEVMEMVRDAVSDSESDDTTDQAPRTLH